MQGYVNSAYGPGYGSGGYGGLISGGGGGISTSNLYGNALESSMQLSNKYASDRANKQNLAMQQYTIDQNRASARDAARSQQRSSVVSGVATAAAAAAAAK